MQLARQARLAAKIVGTENGNDSLLAKLGGDRQFDLPLADIKDRVRSIALNKYFLMLAIPRYHATSAIRAEKHFQVERLLLRWLFVRRGLGPAGSWLTCGQRILS